MSKKPLLDLSEFLSPNDLSEFLPPAAPPKPTEVLSPPELVQLRWTRQLCTCGREYSSQEYGALVRHTISRKIGFGTQIIGKVFIPLMPSMDVSELPQEIIINEVKIFSCPQCLGQKTSADLFPELGTTFIVNSRSEAMPPNTAKWFDMHKTSRQFDIHETLVDMNRRSVDFDDLLTFKTTKLDLQSVAQSLCDPEKGIES